MFDGKQDSLESVPLHGGGGCEDCRAGRTQRLIRIGLYEEKDFSASAGVEPGFAGTEKFSFENRDEHQSGGALVQFQAVYYEHGLSKTVGAS
ncbi:MAG: hypothetical protein LUF78_06865 [Clostridiales bacterium]|nr:hypothetical protein [Clostridiales bacterium]